MHTATVNYKFRFLIYENDAIVEDDTITTKQESDDNPVNNQEDLHQSENLQTGTLLRKMGTI